MSNKIKESYEKNKKVFLGFLIGFLAANFIIILTVIIVVIYLNKQNEKPKSSIDPSIDLNQGTTLYNNLLLTYNDVLHNDFSYTSVDATKIMSVNYTASDTQSDIYSSFYCSLDNIVITIKINTNYTSDTLWTALLSSKLDISSYSIVANTSSDIDITLLEDFKRVVDFSSSLNNKVNYSTPDNKVLYASGVSKNSNGYISYTNVCFDSNDESKKICDAKNGIASQYNSINNSYYQNLLGKIAYN